MIWPHPGPSASAADVVGGSSGFQVQLGDLPTWLLAVFAFLALLAAVAAYRKQSSSDDHLAEQVRTQGDALAEQRKATQALADQAEAQRLALEDQQAVNALQARMLERNLNAFVRQQAEQIRYDQDTFGADEGSPVYRVRVTNESSRPVRDVVCRLAGDQLGEHCTAEWAGRIIRTSGLPRERVRDQVEGERVQLIRKEQTWGFVFPIDAVAAEKIPGLIRFTDDAGLHWQVDNDLHLEQLDSRDW